MMTLQITCKTTSGLLLYPVVSNQNWGYFSGGRHPTCIHPENSGSPWVGLLAETSISWATIVTTQTREVHHDPRLEGVQWRNAQHHQHELHRQSPFRSESGCPQILVRSSTSQPHAIRRLVRCQGSTAMEHLTTACEGVAHLVPVQNISGQVLIHHPRHSPGQRLSTSERKQFNPTVLLN